jgi:glycosyltransferase involved in cell wall biosynthesis
MRIMHITEALGGGVFEVVSNLSAGLADQGHEVAIAYGVRAETPSPLRDAVDQRVELIPTPWTERTLRASLRASRELRPAVGVWNPDVIHLHSSFAGVIGAATLGGLAPTVYTPHGYSFTMNASPLRRRAFRALERRVAHRVEMVGAVSDAEGHLARELVSAPHVKVVPNGIPELNPDQAPGASAERASGVVAMGRVTSQRQPHEVAEILADVRYLAPVSWVGGASEPSAPGLYALARAGVPVSGWLAREEALDRLAKATVYLHWTAWDGMPLSILEAMARDVVVIASDIPPNRSILGAQQVFSSKDDAIAAIRRVLVDESYRHTLLSEQRARRGRYGSTAMMRGWEKLYTALTSESNPPTAELDNPPQSRRSCASPGELRLARMPRRTKLMKGRVPSV